MPYDLGAGGASGPGLVDRSRAGRPRDDRLVCTMADRGLDAPLLVDAGGGPVTGLTPRELQTYAAGGDAAALAAGVARRQRQLDTAVDSVVVSGAPELQAAVVAALQGADVDVPDPAHAAGAQPRLRRRARSGPGGSLSGQLTSVGLDDGTRPPSRRPTPGRSLAAYFSGLQLAAATPRRRTSPATGRSPTSQPPPTSRATTRWSPSSVPRPWPRAPTRPRWRRRWPACGWAPPTGSPVRPWTSPAPRPSPTDAVVPLASTPVSPGVRPADRRPRALLVRQLALLTGFLSPETRRVLTVGAATNEETPCTW